MGRFQPTQNLHTLSTTTTLAVTCSLS